MVVSLADPAVVDSRGMKAMQRYRPVTWLVFEWQRSARANISSQLCDWQWFAMAARVRNVSKVGEESLFKSSLPH
jgi:hypothetical protein